MTTTRELLHVIGTQVSAAHRDSNHISRQVLIALPLLGRRQAVTPHVDTFLKITCIGI